MKTLAALLIFAWGFRALAATGTGLQDRDSITFGMSLFITYDKPDSGGVSVYIAGSKTIRHMSPIAGVWDDVQPITHIDPSKLNKTRVINPKTKAFEARNESFSSTITGQQLNEAYAKAVKACPECVQFYLVVGQDRGWSTFDLLPIQNYQGAHSLNRPPVYYEYTGLDLCNSFIQYRKAE